MRGGRTILIGCLALAPLAGQTESAPAPAAQQAATAPKVETTVGVEGQFLLRDKKPDLRARPVVARSPVLLRIAEMTEDGDYYLYDLRFIGEVPGVYDLRAWLRRVDGRPLTDVEPIPVHVASVLPADHAGTLNEIEPPDEPWVGGYRAALWTVGILWVLPILWMIGRRVRRQGAGVVEGEQAATTLADELRPLVEAARRGELSVRERGRLEMLLLGFWRHRLGWTDLDARAALAKMRNHGDAGRLLRALEDWLHRKPGTVEVDVDDLLEPYAGVAAGALPDLPASLGKVIERRAEDDFLSEERTA